MWEREILHIVPLGIPDVTAQLNIDKCGRAHVLAVGTESRAPPTIPRWLHIPDKKVEELRRALPFQPRTRPAQTFAELLVTRRVAETTHTFGDPA